MSFVTLYYSQSLKRVWTSDFKCRFILILIKRDIVQDTSNEPAFYLVSLNLETKKLRCKMTEKNEFKQIWTLFLWQKMLIEE